MGETGRNILRPLLRLLGPLGCAAALTVGPAGSAPDLPAQASQPNVLVIVADDLGLDFLSIYDDVNALRPGVADDVPQVYPATPTLRRLAAEGVRFTQARAMSTCGATRASLQSGRYPFRHGIGALVRSSDASERYREAATIEFGVGPGNREVTIAHLARAAGSRSLHAGKWHLALHERNPALAGRPGYGWKHVTEVGGYDDHWTVWSNLGDDLGRAAYRDFQVSNNGELESVERYATSALVDHVLAWTAARADEPWLVHAAFNAVHAPFEAAPAELVTTGAYLEAMTVGGHVVDANQPWYAWCTMVEALDRELGRLLDGLDEAGQLDRTVVLFIGDNGTPGEVIENAVQRLGLDLGETVDRLVGSKQQRFKHTVWEAGVRVPLLVRAPNVLEPGRSSDALVDVTDLWPTLAALLEVDTSALLPPGHRIDGVSFLDVLESGAPGSRDFSLVEHFEPNGNPGVIAYEPDAMDKLYLLRRAFVLETEEGRFKLVRNLDADGKGRDRLFQLAGPDREPIDPWELSPLGAGRAGAHRATMVAVRERLEDLLATEPAGRASAESEAGR